MDNEILNYYVAEYSVLQNAFYCDRLIDVIQTNYNISKNKEINDYKIIGIFKTMEEALNYNKQLSELKYEIASEDELRIDKHVNEIFNILNKNK